MKVPKNLKYIAAEWKVHSDFDVAGVNWEDVKRCYIKYNTLTIEYKDGATEWRAAEHDGFDLKWPEKIEAYEAFEGDDDQLNVIKPLENPYYGETE